MRSPGTSTDRLTHIFVIQREMPADTNYTVSAPKQHAVTCTVYNSIQ